METECTYFYTSASNEQLFELTHSAKFLSCYHLIVLLKVGEIVGFNNFNRNKLVKQTHILMVFKFIFNCSLCSRQCLLHVDALPYENFTQKANSRTSEKPVEKRDKYRICCEHK